MNEDHWSKLQLKYDKKYHEPTVEEVHEAEEIIMKEKSLVLLCVCVSEWYILNI